MKVLQSDNQSQYYLEQLNRHFKATAFDRHPEALISGLFSRAYDRYVGNKSHISLRASKRIYEYSMSELRKIYGPWINLNHFHLQTNGHVRFSCNITHVFKTFMGTLYAPYLPTMGEDIFYTSHCFQRYKERVNPGIYEIFKKTYHRRHFNDPTAADILISMIGIFRDGTYARNRNMCYLDITFGILVLEDFDEFFVAKTFLTYDMIKQDFYWVRPDLTEEEIEEPWKYFNQIRDLFNRPTIPSKKPEKFMPESEVEKHLSESSEPSEISEPT